MPRMSYDITKRANEIKWVLQFLPDAEFSGRYQRGPGESVTKTYKSTSANFDRLVQLTELEVTITSPSGNEQFQRRFEIRPRFIDGVRQTPPPSQPQPPQSTPRPRQSHLLPKMPLPDHLKPRG